MFDIKVCGLDEAPTLAFGWATKTISLVDSTGVARPMFGTMDEHMTEVFDDIEADCKGMIRPQFEHILRILTWTETLTDADKLLVHCHAGLCRSTAVALLILVQHDVLFGDAMDLIVAQRGSGTWPNKEIVRLGDGLMEKNGELISLMEIWHEVHLHDWEIIDN